MNTVDVISGAVSFLMAARDQDGRWRDYDVYGPIDIWITAYVGAALAGARSQVAERTASEAWEMLTEMPSHSGGWAYGGPLAPEDADSTAWALRLAETISAPRTRRIEDGYAFLARHLQPTGSLATYSMEVAGPTFEMSGVADSWDGWCAGHDCVTASAACLQGFSARSVLLNYLRRRQLPVGNWVAYWWTDPEHPTALACEAMRKDSISGPDTDAMGAHSGDVERLQAASEWTSTRIGFDGSIRTELDPDGSAFATACAVRILKSAESTDTHDALERSLGWLERTQSTDGGWPASARMRIPTPETLDPTTVSKWGRDGWGKHALGTIVVDGERVFTTATVLRAICEYAK
jgi:squalene-hopene/tetraprenyl-beta-curcumene cyclase